MTALPCPHQPCQYLHDPHHNGVCVVGVDATGPGPYRHHLVKRRQACGADVPVHGLSGLGGHLAADGLRHRVHHGPHRRRCILHFHSDLALHLDNPARSCHRTGQCRPRLQLIRQYHQYLAPDLFPHPHLHLPCQRGSGEGMSPKQWLHMSIVSLKLTQPGQRSKHTTGRRQWRRGGHFILSVSLTSVGPSATVCSRIAGSERTVVH